MDPPYEVSKAPLSEPLLSIWTSLVYQAGSGFPAERESILASSLSSSFRSTRNVDRSAGEQSLVSLFFLGLVLLCLFCFVLLSCSFVCLVLLSCSSVMFFCIIHMSCLFCLVLHSCSLFISVDFAMHFVKFCSTYSKCLLRSAPSCRAASWNLGRWFCGRIICLQGKVRLGQVW